MRGACKPQFAVVVNKSGDLHIHNLNPNGVPRIITNKPGATLNITNCTYDAGGAGLAGAPTIEGWAAVTGACTAGP